MQILLLQDTGHGSIEQGMAGTQSLFSNSKHTACHGLTSFRMQKAVFRITEHRLRILRLISIGIVLLPSPGITAHIIQILFSFPSKQLLCLPRI